MSEWVSETERETEKGGRERGGEGERGRGGERSSERVRKDPQKESSSSC